MWEQASYIEMCIYVSDVLRGVFAARTKRGLIVQCFDHEGPQATKGTTEVTGLKCLFIYIINYVVIMVFCIYMSFW